MNTNLIEKYIFINTYLKNSCAVIEIKDNAGGIPSDIIEKVFEPYFTTKHKSLGTGLGLYMTHQIITKNIEGTIKVTNDEYTYKNSKFTGTNFIINIPL